MRFSANEIVEKEKKEEDSNVSNGEPFVSPFRVTPFAFALSI